MAGRARDLLSENDVGGWTRAAPDLYPHQWSWDTAFIAIGLAHLDTRRAARELETLFAHQWKNGKVPHIVFDEDAPPDSYFPGPEHWASAAAFPDAPSGPARTSCLIQPPVHAVAARHIWNVARERDGEEPARSFLDRIYPKLLAWHRYLATYRDPEGSGLVTIYHPWESGTDNSPRWDAALRRVETGAIPDYERQDLNHVEDPSQRPTDEEYRRFLWLVETIKRARCDEESIYENQQFLVKDVLASAILVAADEALLEIAEAVRASRDERAEISGRVKLGRVGLAERWDPELSLYLDYDLRAGTPLRARTVAGFSPLVAGDLEDGRSQALLRTLRSTSFMGNARLRWPLPPSASPDEAGFHPRSYWRGPVWPVISWLLWWSLRREGEVEFAADLRRTALEQLEAGGFAEYFEPFTGEPLGSLHQSWTAAVALDWLATT